MPVSPRLIFSKSGQRGVIHGSCGLKGTDTLPHPVKDSAREGSKVTIVLYDNKTLPEIEPEGKVGLRIQGRYE